MNGRIYDPVLGRFLQADPFIQAPMNSQSYNRYSYVLNNPLSYTDPGGYFSHPLKKANDYIKKRGRKAIRSAAKVFGAELVNYVGSAVASYFGGAWGAAAWSYEFTRAMGGSSSAALRGAFTAYIGSYVNASDSLNSYQKFAINYGLVEIINSDYQQAKATQMQTVGGTYSQVSGGKFANGAAGSSFEATFNSVPSKIGYPSDEYMTALREIETTDLGRKIFNALSVDENLRRISILRSNGIDLGVTSKHSWAVEVKGTESAWWQFWKPLPEYRTLHRYEISINMNVKDPTFFSLNQRRFTPDLTRVLAHELGHIAIYEGYIRNMSAIDIENTISLQLDPRATVRHPYLGHSH